MREPAVVLLYGLPAAGKYTIARALGQQLQADGYVVRVIDNHYVNNVIFGLLDIDGVKPVTRDVWRKVRDVRNTVFETIRELSPREFTFIFTNYLVKDQDEWAVEEVRELAQARNARLVVARLECDIDELCRRIDSVDRRARMKWADADGLRAVHAARELIRPVEGELVFDTASTPADDVAKAIAAQLLS